MRHSSSPSSPHFAPQIVEVPLRLVAQLEGKHVETPGFEFAQLYDGLSADIHKRNSRYLYRMDRGAQNPEMSVMRK
jgi:hypothetical protein